MTKDTTSPPILELRHISFGGIDLLSDQQRVLNDVNLALFSGNLVALEYESETQYELLKSIIWQRLAPSEGELFWKNKSLSNLQEGARQHIVHQEIREQSTDAALVESLTGRENLLLCRAVRPELQVETVDKWLAFLAEKLSIGDALDLRPEALSVDQAWLLDFGRNLLTTPSLFIVNTLPPFLSQQQKIAVVALLQEYVTQMQAAVLIQPDSLLYDLLPEAYLLHHGTLANVEINHDRFDAHQAKAQEDGLLALDKDFVIRFVNISMRKMLSQSEEDLPGQTLSQCGEWTDQNRIPLDLKRWSLEQWQETPEKTLQESVYLKLANGDIRLLNLRIVPLRQDNQLVAVDIYCKDITHENELNRMKFDFAAITAHELRTPLTSIRGNVEMLSLVTKDKLDEGEGRMLDAIEISTNRLENLVNNLLRITHFGKNIVKSYFKSESWAALVSTTLTTFEHRARFSKIDLGLDNQISGKDAVVCDSVRIIEAVENILSNALDNTPEGGTVRVRIWIDANARKAGFEVKNSGAGIPQEALPHLFTLFYRAQKSDNFTDMHLGLGLHITKQIVDLHGGEVFADTIAGQEATVGFWIPLEPPRNIEST